MLSNSLKYIIVPDDFKWNFWLSNIQAHMNVTDFSYLLAPEKI